MLPDLVKTQGTLNNVSNNNNKYMRYKVKKRHL